MIKNVKVYDKLVEHLYNTKSKTRLVLATLSLAAGLSLSGCSTNKYSELNVNMINSEDTTVKDRKEYYEENVDELLYKMNEAEKENYYVNVELEYVGEENYKGDNIMFLRNDDTYMGDIRNSSNQIYITPGIHRVVSRDVLENNGILGEIEVLKPGETVKLIVNYDTKTVTIDEESKTK